MISSNNIYIIPGNHDDFKSYHRVDDDRINLCEDVVVTWITREGKK